MANRLEQLLDIWIKNKDSLDWILATVIETAGSSYRKSGAMMMINSLGQYHGLISGGCLEADVMRQARKCWANGENKIITYDMREEDDIGWQLGIGCGGMVKILLQPINESNQFQNLQALKENLDNKQPCFYQLDTSSQNTPNQIFPTPPEKQKNTVVHKISPRPTLSIFGGGTDAIPLVNMAKVLGWEIVVIDERVSYARKEQFLAADFIIKRPLEELLTEPLLQRTDVLVIMNHNVRLDALSLKLAQSSSAQFVGMLGPTHRTEKVLKQLNWSYQDLQKPLSNPVGLDIGGELPESIALSILSEAHAVLEGKKGQPIGQEFQRAS